MGRFKALDKLRFRHTYKDNGGVTMTQVCDLGRLRTLYGVWLGEMLADDDFVFLKMKRGLRETTIEPTTRAGR